MQYNGVSHGHWCNARTHRSKCKACKAEVFYFSCDCGCKVYFASLGGKWPEHICIDKAISQENNASSLHNGSVSELMKRYTERVESGSRLTEEERKQRGENRRLKRLRERAEKRASKEHKAQLAQGIGAWLATQYGRCHYRARKEDKHFACGVRVNKHGVVDSQEVDNCVECLKCLNLPLPKPQPAQKPAAHPSKENTSRSVDYVPPKGKVRLFG